MVDTKSRLQFHTKDWQDGGLTFFSQTCFAEYWDDLPQVLSAPVDPYNFTHRMALGKYIIENTGSRDVWSEGYKMHWFWGYLAQLDWQKRSGRLSSPDSTFDEKRQGQGHTDNISPDAWFGYMNANFSVAVYVGAAKAGLVPEIVIGENAFDIEKNAGFQKCVNIWQSFWSGPHKKFIDAISSESFSKDKAIDILYKDLWESHTGIIKASLPHAKVLEDRMPELEKQFGLGWCRMVELLAAMSWTLLSLDALLEHGAGQLPSCKLDEISMKFLKEHRKDEFKTANSMIDLYKARTSDISKMCSFYRRLAAWKVERQRMPNTMKILTSEGRTGVKICVVLRLIAVVLLPQSIVEFISWLFLIAAIVLAV